MSNVTDNFKTHFNTNWTTKAQQKISRLRTRCRVKTGCTGERETHDLVDSISDQEVTGQRYKKVNLNDLPTDLISVFPREFQIETGDSKWDEIALLPTVSPRGAQLIAHAAAFNRRCDQLVIAGLGGDQQTGKNGTTAVPFPASQKIAKDYVESGTPGDSNLTVAKLLEAISLMERNEVFGQDQMEAGLKLHIAASSKMLKHLKNDASNKDGSRLFSKDFLPPVLDENGRIKEFLGLDFVRTEYCDFLSTDATIQFAYVWVTDGLLFDSWADMTTSVDIRPDLSNAVQYLSQYKLGTGRMENKKVIQIACKIAN